MYKLTITNYQGASMEFNKLGGPYTISEIEGLNPPKANINTTTSALMDGGRYNSAKAEMRVLQIAFAIEYNAEEYRLAAYNVLQVKRAVTIAYKSEKIDVFIEGYVQSVNNEYFAAKQIMTCEILCPSPWWKTAQEIINSFSLVTPRFHFPFASVASPAELIMGEIGNKPILTIRNEGTVATGMQIELYARAVVENPKIINYLTGDYIQLDFAMQSGDLITIDTSIGNKTVDLLRGSTHTSIFNNISENSKWLELLPGDNTFVYTVGTGNSTNLTVTFYHYDLFEGV